MPYQLDRLSISIFVASVVIAGCGASNEAASTSPAAAESAIATDEATPETATTNRSPGASTADPILGEPLADPTRYYGIYANSETPKRRWFVTEARRPPEAEQAPEVPPGYLAVGAMFGDVAPWNMKTLSTTEFEQAWKSDFQPEAVSVEFELGSDGGAVAMSFTNQQNLSEGRLERQGDLPEDWQ